MSFAKNVESHRLKIKLKQLSVIYSKRREKKNKRKRDRETQRERERERERQGEKRKEEKAKERKRGRAFRGPIMNVFKSGNAIKMCNVLIEEGCSLQAVVVNKSIIRELTCV